MGWPMPGAFVFHKDIFFYFDMHFSIYVKFNMIWFFYSHIQYEITSIYLENKAEIKCICMYVCDNIGTLNTIPTQ